MVEEHPERVVNMQNKVVVRYKSTSGRSSEEEEYDVKNYGDGNATREDTRRMTYTTFSPHNGTTYTRQFRERERESKRAATTDK